MFVILTDGFQMFSAEHFITLAVILTIILILFFTRKFFIKFKYLDLAFRLILGGLIIGSEIGLRTMNIPSSVFENFPVPLCGHLLWLAGLALLSNSERIYRRIYPLCLLGATLSMSVVGGIPHFPAFRAWQYFIVHGGFLIGALYFVFTRKINKFDWKDYGWSCLLLLAMGGFMAMLSILGVEDEYMAIKPIEELRGLYDSIGQLAYTLLFMSFAALMMALFTLITWLLTRKRNDEDKNVPSFKQNDILDIISSKYNKTARWVTLTALISFMGYLLAVQDITKNDGVGLAYFLLVYIIITLAVVAFNEILHNYDNYHELLEK